MCCSAGTSPYAIFAYLTQLREQSVPSALPTQHMPGPLPQPSVTPQFEWRATDAVQRSISTHIARDSARAPLRTAEPTTMGDRGAETASLVV